MRRSPMHSVACRVGMQRGFVVACLVAVGTPVQAQAPASPMTAGWLEQVTVVDAGGRVEAKLDTGAEHSSLHATAIERLVRDGGGWVRFSVRLADGRDVLLERPLRREVRIKRHDAASQPRPVVRLTLCIGGLSRDVEVNLVDRSAFDFPMLVGRSFLRDQLLVDAGRQYLLPAGCVY